MPVAKDAKETGSKDILPPGINTIKKETEVRLKEIMEAPLPKKVVEKKRPKTAKRKRKNSQDSEEDGPLHGTLIEEKKTQLIPPVNKADFKYFKPWLPDNNLPKWADDLQDQPLDVIMGDLNKKPPPKLFGMKIAGRKREPVINLKKVVEVDHVTDFDFSRWTVKDAVLEYVQKMEQTKEKLKRAGINIDSQQESGKNQESEYDHGERLGEIYGKFITAFEDFKDKNNLLINIGDLTESFDP